jgi:hypothetical protein
MSSFPQAKCREILRKFLEVAGAKRSASWYAFGLPEDDPHSVYSFCRMSKETLDQFMGLCGLAVEINGALCLKQNLLVDFVESILNVEHSFTKLSGYGYPSKKLHCFRIGSFKKGSACFDMKNQLRMEEKNSREKPRQPRASIFHRELSDHIDLVMEALEDEDDDPPPLQSRTDVRESESNSKMPPLVALKQQVLFDTPMKIQLGANKIEEVISKDDFPYLSKLGISLSTDYDISCILREIDKLASMVESVDLRKIQYGNDKLGSSISFPRSSTKSSFFKGLRRTKWLPKLLDSLIPEPCTDMEDEISAVDNLLQLETGDEKATTRADAIRWSCVALGRLDEDEFD